MEELGNGPWVYGVGRYRVVSQHGIRWRTHWCCRGLGCGDFREGGLCFDVNHGIIVGRGEHGRSDALHWMSVRVQQLCLTLLNIQENSPMAPPSVAVADVVVRRWRE